MNRDRVYFLDTYVAGRLYGDADLAWPHLRVGQKISLVREDDNEKDPGAIALHVRHGDETAKLGYVPMRKNQPIPSRMAWGGERPFKPP